MARGKRSVKLHADPCGGLLRGYRGRVVEARDSEPPTPHVAVLRSYRLLPVLVPRVLVLQELRREQWRLVAYSIMLLARAVVALRLLRVRVLHAVQVWDGALPMLLPLCLRVRALPRKQADSIERVLSLRAMGACRLVRALPHLVVVVCASHLICSHFRVLLYRTRLCSGARKHR